MKEVSVSVENTEAVGRSLASRLDADRTLPRFIALYGDLGVGKTAFVRGFVSFFMPTVGVKSPTFNIIHEYSAHGYSVFHFDMYRIESEDDLYSIGFDDYLRRPGFCLCEWSEKIPYALPDDYFAVSIAKVDPHHPDIREITVERKTK